MKLSQNPFYILKLTCSSGRREIMAAAEEMGFFLETSVCAGAQNALINPAKRLSAELEWFIDIPDFAQKSIRNNIEQNEPIPADALSSLSKLNATLYNFSIIHEKDPYELETWIMDIDEQYSCLNVHEITELINKNREKGKISSVQEKEVSAELHLKREDIRQSISDILSAIDDEIYIKLITSLAEDCISDDKYNDGVVISDVLDQYEIRMQATLEEYADLIRERIENIKAVADDSPMEESIAALIGFVKHWDTIAQPLQLKSQASGMPHENSENLGHELRDLALYLHNEKGKTSEALTLVEAMKSVFAELDDLSEQFVSDITALKNILKNDGKAKEIVSDLDALVKLSDTVKTYSVEANVNRFIAEVKRLNAKFKQSGLDTSLVTKARESLCIVARNTAIDLHNSKHLTLYASNISMMLVDEFIDLPTLSLTLYKDVATLGQQLRLGTPYIPSRTYPSNASRSSSYSSKSKNSGCGKAVLIVIVLFCLLSLVSNCNTPSKSSYSSSSAYSRSTSRQTATSKHTTSYTIILNSDGGTGGSTRVTVKKGSAMPSATAPSKSGYIFMGYYSARSGGGIKYYDANMKSVHSWDTAANGTLYAYWQKKNEAQFSSNVSDGDPVFADIVSITPYVTISTTYNGKSSSITDVVCRCKTKSGSIIYVYMTISEYTSKIDSKAMLYSGYADTVRYSSAKRIHGTARRAESMCNGLSAKTGAWVLKFSSIS